MKHDSTADGPEVEFIAFLKTLSKKSLEYLLSKLFPVRFFRIPEDEIEHWTWLEPMNESDPRRPLGCSESGAGKAREKEITS
jgi:hypothetical protein